MRAEQLRARDAVLLRDAVEGARLDQRLEHLAVAPCVVDAAAEVEQRHERPALRRAPQIDLDRALADALHAPEAEADHLRSAFAVLSFVAVAPSSSPPP